MAWTARDCHCCTAAAAATATPRHNAQRMEAERDDAAETESQRLGVVSFVRHGEALSGLFQQRYCDFHVHELERPGEAVQFCSLPGRADVPPLPDAAAGIEARVLQFVLYKENRTTSDALQLATAASIPVAALRAPRTAVRSRCSAAAGCSARVSPRPPPPRSR